MITLAILCLIYSILAFKRFKKIYGTYDIFSESPKAWTLALVFTTAYIIVMSIGNIVIYLP